MARTLQTFDGSGTGRSKGDTGPDQGFPCNKRMEEEEMRSLVADTVTWLQQRKIVHLLAPVRSARSEASRGT
jgi:hypothetical protein